MRQQHIKNVLGKLNYEHCFPFEVEMEFLNCIQRYFDRRQFFGLKTTSDCGVCPALLHYSFYKTISFFPQPYCRMYIIQYTIYSTYICMYTLYSVYCITFCCLEQPWMLKISLKYYIISKIYIPCYRYFTITALSDCSEFLLRIIISYLLYDNRFQVAYSLQYYLPGLFV